MNALSGLVLAGGKSTRMGRDKALIKYDGLPLIEHQIRKLAEAGCKPIFISGRGYEKFGQTVEDLIPDCGPMGGIYSGLKKVDSDRCLVLAVDLPHVRASFLQLLIEKSSGVDVAYPVSTHGAEPLCAVYRKECCLPVMEKFIQNKELSLQNLIQTILKKGKGLGIKKSEWKKFGSDLFSNLNSPEDLKGIL